MSGLAVGVVALLAEREDRVEKLAGELREDSRILDQPLVAAAMEEERPALPVARELDLAEKQRVVAAPVRADDTSDEVGERAVDERRLVNDLERRLRAGRPRCDRRIGPREPVWCASRTLTPKRVPSCSSAPILARRSIETRTSGGRSETDMNAFAVMPCTCSATRVLSTVTPVANIPSVRRNATAGSPSSPSPSSSASESGATSYEAPNASAEAIALSIATSNSGGLETFHARDSDDKRGGAAGAAPPRSGSERPRLRRAHLLGRSAASRASGIVGVSSRQCGLSLSCTIRRKRKRRMPITRTETPMIFSFVSP